MSVHESEALADVTREPALRLLPAPPSEPPYDDELVPRPVLRLVGASAPVPAAPIVPVPRAMPVALRLLPGGADDDEPGPVRTPRADLPSPRPFAHALVQRLLEVLAGLRPVAQLRPDTSLELFEELEHAVRRMPLTTGPRPTRRDVRSLHVQEQEDGVAEVCATVHRGSRAGALALRLEGVNGGWRCTALIGV